MKIGVLGSGNIGGRVGVHWANAGHDVVFSSRHPEKLSHLVDATGGKAKAATPEQAVAHAEVILLAIPYPMLDEVLASAGSLAGKIIIDATNPYSRDFKGLAVPEGSTGLAELQKKVPSARVVKAFNTMVAKILTEGANREDRYVVFLSGDDASAKEIVSGLIHDAGFSAYDIGDKSQTALQEPFGVLYNKTFTRAEADKILAGTRGATAR